MHYSQYLRYSIVTVMFGSMLLGSSALAYEQKTIELDPGQKLQDNTHLGSSLEKAPDGTLQPAAVATASRTINLLLGLLGTLCLALMIYAGYLWLSAQGREEDMTKAKDIITGTVLGMLVVLASYSFMYFIFRNLVNATD